MKFSFLSAFLVLLSPSRLVAMPFCLELPGGVKDLEVVEDKIREPAAGTW